MKSYDYLRFEHPYHPMILEHFSEDELEVEIHSSEGTQFQTKSFEKNLDTYTITGKGRLLRQHQGIEAVPVKERPRYNTPHWNVADKKLRNYYRREGATRTVLLEAEDTEHHGYLHFYAYRKKKFVEFRAKFTDGQLIGIKKLSDPLSEAKKA